MRKKNLLIAAAMLTLPALANETPTVTVTKSNGENITFEMADMMNGAYLTANADSPLSLVVYTGQITTNENGEFVVDETNPQPDQRPGRIYLVAALEDLHEVSFSHMDRS